MANARRKGVATRSLMDLLSGATGVGAIMAAMGVGLGLALSFLVDQIPGGRVVSNDIPSIVSAPAFGWAMWASLSAAVIQAGLIKRRGDSVRLSRGARQFISGQLKYSTLFAFVWIIATAVLVRTFK